MTEKLLSIISELIKNKLKLDDDFTGVEFYKKAKLVFSNGKIVMIKVFPKQDVIVFPVGPIKDDEMMTKQYGLNSFIVSKDSLGRINRVGFVNDYVEITENEDELIEYYNKISKHR